MPEENNKVSGEVFVPALGLAPDLLGEITVFVSDMGAPVSAVSMRANKNGTVTIHMVLQVSSKEQLRQAVTRIQKRSDVLEAFRSVS